MGCGVTPPHSQNKPMHKASVCLEQETHRSGFPSVKPENNFIKLVLHSTVKKAEKPVTSTQVSMVQLSDLLLKWILLTSSHLPSNKLRNVYQKGSCTEVFWLLTLWRESSFFYFPVKLRNKSKDQRIWCIFKYFHQMDFSWGTEQLRRKKKHLLHKILG